jgi:signal transduction histidine kinase
VRSRILRVALTAAVLAVLVTGIPAGFAIAGLVSSGERTELQGLSLRAAARVGTTFRSGDQVELPATEPGVQLGVYTPEGRRVQGTGPTSLSVAEAGRVSGAPVSTIRSGQLVEVVPVHNGEHVIGAVRASSPTSGVWRTTVEWWLAIAAAAGVAVGCAAVYAARQSRRLSEPIDDLTGSVLALGEGVFTLDPDRTSGVPEIDQASRSVRRTAQRLGDLVDRERSFTAGASHQLRTPLTHLQLSLESGLAGSDQDLRRAAEEAMSTADVLSQTIDDVLAMARTDPADRTLTDPGEVVETVASLWRATLAAHGRQLRLQVQETPDVSVSRAVLRQAVTTLVDNAVKHGAGTVTLRVRKTFEAVAVDVVDEGTGTPIDPRADASLGLRMAVTVIERAGGRVVTNRTDATVFTLLLPATDPGPGSDQHRPT